MTSTGEYISKILRNDNGGNVFTDIGAQLTGFQTASACWVDYNNDGQLDACLSGDSGGGIMTKLYRNQGGTFTEVPFTFFGLAAGQVQWADLDNDGDMDLLESGMDQNVDGHVIIYRNDGNDQFTRLDILENNLINTSSAIADYDNDGWPDIIVMGKVPGCGGTAATVLYHNEWFMNFFQAGTDIAGFKNGSVQFGDYNNDGYSDLILSGYNGYDAYQTEIYGNTIGSGQYSANTPPAAPVGLTSSIQGYTAILSWNRPDDAETPSDGLSYNLFIGTTPQSANIVSPMADLATGALKVVSAGNASSDTSWSIAGLTPGTYYWSVQAVDNGFLASTFPEAQTFTVLYTDAGNGKGDQMGVWPNPAEDHVRISLNQAVTDEGIIFDVNGRIVQKFLVDGTSVDLDIRSLDAGCYMIRVGNSSSRFLKK